MLKTRIRTKQHAMGAGYLPKVVNERGDGEIPRVDLGNDEYLHPLSISCIVTFRDFRLLTLAPKTFNADSPLLQGISALTLTPKDF